MSDILTEERALQNAKVTSFCFKKQLPPPPKNLGTPSVFPTSPSLFPLHRYSHKVRLSQADKI